MDPLRAILAQGQSSRLALNTTRTGTWKADLCAWLSNARVRRHRYHICVRGGASRRILRSRTRAKWTFISWQRRVYEKLVVDLVEDERSSSGIGTPTALNERVGGMAAEGQIWWHLRAQRVESSRGKRVRYAANAH